MENKINIAQLLKDCPSGMELDCTMWDNVTLKSVSIDSNYPIAIAHQAGEGVYTTDLTEYGCWVHAPNAKCVIFPKGRTTWEGFVSPCKFNTGDRIRQNKKNPVCLVSEVCDNHYLLDEKDIILPFFAQDEWDLVPNKFDINTLIAFESRVLVRNSEDQYWIPAFWGYRVKDGYVTTFGFCNYCIPYEENEHLLKTKDDCSDFYKTWK